MTTLYKRWTGVRPSDLAPDRRPNAREANNAGAAFAAPVEYSEPNAAVERTSPAAMDYWRTNTDNERPAKSSLPRILKAVPEPSASAPLARLSKLPRMLLGMPLREARDVFERVYFEQLLAHEGGSITHVAEKSGMERTHLYRKLKTLGLNAGKKGQSR